MGATRRIEKTAATRAKVVAVARDLFTAHGFERVGIREVAVAAGLSTGAIFGHFANKEELFEGATGRKPPMVRVREWLEREAAGTPFAIPPETPAQLLADLFGAER